MISQIGQSNPFSFNPQTTQTTSSSQTKSSSQPIYHIPNPLIFNPTPSAPRLPQSVQPLYGTGGGSSSPSRPSTSTQEPLYGAVYVSPSGERYVGSQAEIDRMASITTPVAPAPAPIPANKPLASPNLMTGQSIQPTTSKDFTTGTPLQTTPLQNIFVPSNLNSRIADENQRILATQYSPNPSPNGPMFVPTSSLQPLSISGISKSKPEYVPSTVLQNQEQGFLLESKARVIAEQKGLPFTPLNQLSIMGQSSEWMYPTISAGVQEEQTFFPTYKQSMGFIQSERSPLSIQASYEGLGAVGGISVGLLETPRDIELFGKGSILKPVETIIGIPLGYFEAGKTVFSNPSSFQSGRVFGSYAGQAIIFGGLAKGTGALVKEVKFFGKTEIPASKVFDVTALERVEAGGKYYPASPGGVAQMISRFKEGSLKAQEFFPENKTFTVSASQTEFAKSTAAIPGSSETPGLYVAPFSRGSPTFLGIAGEAEAASFQFTLNPLESFKGSTPSTYIIKTETPVVRIPSKFTGSIESAQRFFGAEVLITSGKKTGFFNTYAVLKEPIAERGTAYSSPFSEFGSPVGGIKYETEAIIPYGTQLKRTGFKYFTKVSGEKVPLFEYSALKSGVEERSKTSVSSSSLSKQMASSYRGYLESKKTIVSPIYLTEVRSSTLSNSGLRSSSVSSVISSTSLPKSSSNVSSSFSKVVYPVSSSITSRSSSQSSISSISSFVSSTSSSVPSSTPSYSPPSIPSTTYTPPSSPPSRPPSSPPYKIPPYYPPSKPPYRTPPYTPPSYPPSYPPYKYPPYTPPGTPPIKIPSSRESGYSKLSRAFDVYLRESLPKGKSRVKPYKIAAGLPRQLAVKVGLEAADVKTARTAIIVPAGTTSRSDIEGVSSSLLARFRKPKGVSKISPREPLTFVEKSKFAISSKLEKIGIPEKAAQLRRSGLFKSKRRKK